ncbi:DUF3168 domain-containing protein [Herbaspirillum sp. VT-16-41]|uniref:tail completion protein gp17 n=1 Tax=Herbaspirillum sp. VT-16-41 TaxID=1953765 RepID=UPI000980BD30|nr:DUF3168 domain-containing protein [Herbaspirillum sp. VT-16-41]ONN68131.1 hypothetical protein BTM36_01885 [Herbaspirillum sp. VT-16-41]
MTLEETIVAAIQTVPALAAQPIRPNAADDADRAPYVIYRQVGGRREQVLRGDCGLANPRVQIDVYAETALQAASLKKAIRTAILDTPALSATLIDEGSGEDPASKLQRQRQDFSFWFQDPN